MHVQNLLATTNIGQGDIHLTVKTPRAQQGCIKNIGAVGSSHHNHARIGFKPVHLNQQLVKRLLTLIIAAAQSGTTLATYGINLINKNDAGRIFLSVFKHIAHARCAYANKHFNKV